MNKKLAILIGLLLLILGIGYIYFLDNSSIDGTANKVFPSMTPTQERREPVYLELEKNIFQHDDKVFEPVHYSLVNNSPEPIYFLSGCAVVLTKVYKIENTKRINIFDSREIMCQAEPNVNEIKSGTRVKLGWDQKVPGGFVQDGEYQLALTYSYERPRDLLLDHAQEAISDTFGVKFASLNPIMQKEFCNLLGSEFLVNEISYQQSRCLESLK